MSRPPYAPLLLVLGWFLGLGLAAAEGDAGMVAPAVQAINQGATDARSAGAAVVLLLSALLAIAVVIMLFKRTGGGGN